MNEQRLVTMILAALLVAGTAGLAAVYFASKGPVPSGPVATATSKKKTIVSHKIEIGPQPPLDQASPNVPKDIAGHLVGQTALNPSNDPVPHSEAHPLKQVGPDKIDPASLPASTPLLGSVKASTSRPEKIILPATGPLPEATMETSKANGTFYSAQPAREGIITGARGTPGDLADYYKVKAKGSSMALRLESSQGEAVHGFVLGVFDSDFKPVNGSKEKTDAGITISVKQGDTYYIKLDLGRAPIRDPMYRLHIRFDP